MEALQRIQVFRVFDVFALLDCLHGLRAGRLQQVGVQLRGASDAQWCESCHAVSRCVTLCHAVSRCVTLCHAVSRCVTLCHVVSRCVTLCHAVSRCVTLCHAVSRCVTLCHVVSRCGVRRTAAAPSRRWSWTRCRRLSLLSWEENRMKVSSLSGSTACN